MRNNPGCHRAAGKCPSDPPGTGGRALRVPSGASPPCTDCNRPLLHSTAPDTFATCAPSSTPRQGSRLAPRLNASRRRDAREAKTSGRLEECADFRANEEAGDTATRCAAVRTRMAAQEVRATSATAGNAAHWGRLAMTPDSDMQLMKHPYCWIMWGFNRAYPRSFFYTTCSYWRANVARSRPETLHCPFVEML